MEILQNNAWCFIVLYIFEFPNNSNQPANENVKPITTRKAKWCRRNALDAIEGVYLIFHFYLCSDMIFLILIKKMETSFLT